MNKQIKQLGINRYGIIQLSDIQFGRKHRFANPSDFVDKLIDDINKVSQEHNFRSKYIVLSGDITETGNAKEFSRAASILGTLSDRLGVERKNILCVPGNHDVNWKLAENNKDSNKNYDEQLKFEPYFKFVRTLTKNHDTPPKDRFIRVIDKIPIIINQKDIYQKIEFLLLKLTDFRLRGVFPGGGSQVFHDCI
jgi:predicted MPP superfamily phosphohydrolase